MLPRATAGVRWRVWVCTRRPHPLTPSSPVGLSQKKKPKAAEKDEQSVAPEEPAGEDEEEIDFSKKKKKKPKEAAEKEEEDGESLDFAAKKKKKKKAKGEGEEGEEGAEGDDDDEELNFSAMSIKKGAGDDDDDDDDDDDEADDYEGDGAGGFVSIPADREYKCEELLDRMYSLLHANNPELAGDRKRFLIKPPQVVREGSKRVVLVNFGDICKTLNRSLDHVYSFMLAEMGTTGSIDASSRMVIKGRFPPKAIEQIIRRYVGEYVSCSSCKSPATTLQKQNRLYFMQCNNCGARRSVTPIKTGFVAISRGARKKNRA